MAPLADGIHTGTVRASECDGVVLATEAAVGITLARAGVALFFQDGHDEDGGGSFASSY